MKSIIKLGLKLLCYTLLIYLNTSTLLAKDDCNLIFNGNFSNEGDEWIHVFNRKNGAEGKPKFDEGIASFTIESTGEENSNISLGQRGIYIEKGVSYQIRFIAKAETARPITVAVSDVGNEYSTLSKSNKDFDLTTEWVVYEYSFNADVTDLTTRLVFMLGASTSNVYIDDVSMKSLNCVNCMPAGTPCDDNDACTINDKEDGKCNCVGKATTNNQIINGDFADAFLPWRAGITKNEEDEPIAKLISENGEAYFEIEQVGIKNWNIALEQRNLSIEANQHYKISFRAKASEKRNINVKISDVNGSWTTYFSEDVELSNSIKYYTFDYMPLLTDTEVRMVFNMGLETPNVTIDDVAFEAYNCEPCKEEYKSDCDDGDPCTINDYYNASCECVSYTEKEQYINNGNFSDQFAGWSETVYTDTSAITKTEAATNFDKKYAHFEIESYGTKPWHISLEQRAIPFIAGETYSINFRAKAALSQNINLKISDHGESYATYFNEDVTLTETWKAFRYEFNPKIADDSTRIIFNMGIDELKIGPNEIFIDDVSITNKACSIYTPVHPEDSVALVQFYEQSCKTDCDLDWYLSRPAHTWEGVEIENERVVGLNAAGKGLLGSITYLNLPKLRELDLSENNFTWELADFSKLQFLEKLDVSKNRFSFNAIAANLDANIFIPNFIYKPQYFNNEETYLLNNGEDRILQLTSKMLVNTERLSFQWKRNNEEIIGATNSSYALTNMNLEKIGIYTLHITDESLVPELEIISEPNYVLLNGHDLNGQQIYNNEIMMLFDNEKERDLFAAKYLNPPYNGRISFQCDCDLLLYLWQFESSEKATEVLLDIDRARVGSNPRGVAKGNPNQSYIANPNNIQSETPGSEKWKWPEFDNVNLNDEVNVYLLDTGLDLNNLGDTNFLMDEAPNTCFNEAKASGYGFITNQKKISTQYQDTNGHGTYGYNAITGGKDGVNNPIVWDNVPSACDEFNNRSIGVRVTNVTGFPHSYKISVYAGNVLIHAGFDIGISQNSTAALLLSGVPTGNYEVRLEQDGTTIEQRNYTFESCIAESIDLNNLIVWDNAPSACDEFDKRSINVRVTNVTSFPRSYKISVYSDNTFIHASGDIGISQNSTAALILSGIPAGNYEVLLEQDGTIIEQRNYTFKPCVATGINPDNLDKSRNLKVVPIKIFTENGEGSMFHFVCGLFHSIDNNADIINVSAGFKGGDPSIMETALQMAQQKGIFITAAAGNEGEDIDSNPQYPAFYAGKTYQKQRFDTSGLPSLDENGELIFDSVRYDNIISIASLNSQNELADSSNYGVKSVTLSAYGENLVGFGLDGKEIIYSGTSMATFFTTRELAKEIATDNSRTYNQIWNDFEENYLIENEHTTGKTITGKQINVNLAPLALSAKLGKMETTHQMIRTFPNPSNRKINLVLDCNMEFSNDTEIQISVLDIAGIEKIGRKVDCNTSIQFDISTFTKGIYLIKASNNSMHYYSKFVVE